MQNQWSNKISKNKLHYPLKYHTLTNTGKLVKERQKERKKISWAIAQYNNEMAHTIGLSEYDGIRKMLNINYKGKIPSKATVAENWKDLIIRKFSILFIDLPNFSVCSEVV